MTTITGKVAVVTGANKGIGLELTRQLASRGNTVFATARKPKDAAELHNLAKSADVRVMELDVTSPQSIDVFANNLKSVTSEELMTLFTTNTMGPLLVTQAVYKLGLLGGKAGKSTVANMTSKMGSIDDNGSGGYYAYRASKCALNIINKSLSVDLARDGIESVLLHPGFVKTPMTNNIGNIDAATSAGGLLSMLESGKPLNGRWYGWNGEEIPW